MAFKQKRLEEAYPTLDYQLDSFHSYTEHDKSWR